MTGTTNEDGALLLVKGAIQTFKISLYSKF
jgi:hypothetical protein